MSEVHFKKHRVFRETDDVIFYDISVEESNASDLVVHTGAATSPPNDRVGAKQFYIHKYQDDYNRVVSGERQFELVNFDSETEFIPVSCADTHKLYKVLMHEKPVVHTLGE